MTYTYDHANRRTEMSESSGYNTYWFYDDDNRLTGIATPYLGGNSTTAGLSYGYDIADRKISTTLNGAGEWQYGYDNGNRLTSVESPYSGGDSANVTGLHYNPDNTL